ncbi:MULTISPECIES: Re/Si-specific NAD(P)(+) transhydrogenase subunit alpha [Chromobacteriaceae]|uniref:proton-translocating NAD(P)(+) transhydrogenase n=1 Tax=Pseudogulbenkiania ferrooxidans EGD-HP2 TaxID=1388764 RepID=A0ABN0N216_9NEIS|nr:MULTISPECIES: Re/Si-specific NAD(P)(+) transhydrogenase subunit alpha [Chromobacteriaceae]AVG15421.1 NAD(P)(+) transhydrogenase (Re/Si-specific) subunit alpha [Chromobacterium vaccinii]ERE00029.1 NAD(P) transhydrogenase subunit alpha [Pseudogulbenkiania ferrooxidans EGD-HP2]
MNIVIPAERLAGEHRVAATPDTVKKLVGAGHAVAVEQGAGLAAALPDAAFVAAGATIAERRQEMLAAADIVLAVRMPEAADVAALKPGAVLVGMLAPYQNPLLPQLAAQRVSAFALELLPRTTRAQSMDVLSSQNNIAGYKAVLLAGQFYPRFMPMLMTAAGTVKAAKTLVLGVGVAGLQAIATAKRLGAVVEAYDVRPATREQVESLGAKFVEVPMSDEEKAASGGVYAREMSADFQARQNALIAQRAAAADIVISTALIPGKPAPRLLSADAVAAMKPGSVIVDLAAEAGGNCELTRPGEAWLTDNGVHLVGLTNLPAMLAADASSLYARNLHTFLGLLLTPEGLKIDLEDDLVAATLVAHQGEQRFGAVVRPAEAANHDKEPHHG